MVKPYPASITPDELDTLKAEYPNLCVLDVRTPEEHQHLGVIPGATLLPIQQLPQQLNTLDTARPTVVVCEHGVRSENACQYMVQQGFKHLYNMGCGMASWPGEREFPVKS